MESHVERQLHQEHPQSLQWVEEEECQRLRSFPMQVLRKYSSKKFIGVNGALVISLQIVTYRYCRGTRIPCALGPKCVIIENIFLSVIVQCFIKRTILVKVAITSVAQSQ